MRLELEVRTSAIRTTSGVFGMLCQIIYVGFREFMDLGLPYREPRSGLHYDHQLERVTMPISLFLAT
jgi:hypothetical protein